MEKQSFLFKSYHEHEKQDEGWITGMFLTNVSISHNFARFPFRSEWNNHMQKRRYSLALICIAEKKRLTQLHLRRYITEVINQDQSL